MIRLLTRGGIAAAFACLLGMVLLAPMAQAKHDSNSLDKFGRAVEYPFRKTSENTSVAIHQAEGRKSVVHRRNGNKTYRSIVTSNGRVHRLYRVGHHSRHYRHYRHHSHR